MFKSDGIHNTMGRGLLGDAPIHLPPNHVQPHVVPGPTHQPGPRVVNAGRGLLGDAPDQYRSQYRSLASHGLVKAEIAQQNPVTPQQSVYQHPTFSLTQQLRKLREMNARVILLNLGRPASDDQIIGIGQKFGEVKNYLNTTKGKAWLEFAQHVDAYKAMEGIGNHEVMHMNLPITVQLSNWKEIVRKDGRDLWKASKRQRPADDAGNDTDEPDIKVRRASNASSHRSLTSQSSAAESLEQSLESAHTIAKEVQRSEQCENRSTLEKCLQQAQQIVAIITTRLDEQSCVSDTVTVDESGLGTESLFSTH